MSKVDLLGIEARWPELFEELTPSERKAVANSLAAIWHEGWVPNREDVENLTDKVRGEIDFDEYMRRVSEKAKRVSSAREDG